MVAANKYRTEIENIISIQHQRVDDLKIMFIKSTLITLWSCKFSKTNTFSENQKVLRIIGIL